MAVQVLPCRDAGGGAGSDEYRVAAIQAKAQRRHLNAAGDPVDLCMDPDALPPARVARGRRGHHAGAGALHPTAQRRSEAAAALRSVHHSGAPCACTRLCRHLSAQRRHQPCVAALSRLPAAPRCHTCIESTPLATPPHVHMRVPAPMARVPAADLQRGAGRKPLRRSRAHWSDIAALACRSGRMAGGKCWTICTPSGRSSR